MRKLFTFLGLLTASLSTQAQNYCSPQTTSPCTTATIDIAKVVTTGGTVNINNTNASCGTTYSGYSLYGGTGNLLQAPAGSSSVKISVYPGKVGTSGTVTWSYRCYVWVDWNHDKVFNNVFYNPSSPLTDTGELMVISVNLDNATGVALPIPPRAKNGLTRMRIRMYGILPSTTFPAATPAADPCLATATLYGEVEDYDLYCDNPCVKVPSVSFSNTNSKGTDVSWAPKGNEQRFEYRVDQSPGTPGNGNTLLKNNITNLHLPDTFMKFLPCATKFYFHIRSVCDTMDGSNQALWYYGPWRTETFTTDQCCDVPADLHIGNILSNSALASWGPVSSVQNYEYQIRIDTIVPTKGTITNNTTLTLPGLACSKEYYFFIRSLCSPTPTSDWKVDSFLTQPCLSIDNTTVMPEFHITAYPNPVRDVVTLTVLHGIKQTDASIIVTDITGNVIKRATMTEDKIDIDLRNEAPGIYLVKYADGERTQVVKINKI